MAPPKPGIYTFWNSTKTFNRPIYIGLSKNIRKRLMEHRTGCHNPKLRNYIRGYGRSLIIRFLLKENFDENLSLLKIEKTFIKRLNPITNSQNNII